QWGSPAPITYGTQLGSAQLNATANVPGSFVYTPSAGTLLHAGNDQPLTVVFTPQDLQNYLRVTNGVTIDVLPAPLSIRADDKTRMAGQPNPPLTATFTGLVPGDLPSSLERPPTLTTTATIDSPPGNYPIIVSGASDPDYSITLINGTLTVTPVLPPTITVQPRSQTNFVSQTVQFSVEAAGAPPLRYQWLKDGGLLPNATNATLVLTQVTLSDAGVYRVMVANRAGSVMSEPARLVVLPPHTGPGSLDLTFHPRSGLDGWRYGLDCIDTQPDGKLLIGGYFTNYSGVPRNSFVRLNPDGSLDTDFAPQLSTPEDYPAGVTVVALQPDGKILIGGWFDSINGTPRRNFARLHPDGRLDEGFSAVLENGTVQAIALQRDGKILVGGSFEIINGTARRFLARLNGDGTLDESFQPAPLEIGDDWYVKALGLQSDGKILVAGHIFDVPWESYLGVARLLPDGSLDAEFREHVKADYAVFYLFVQPDDKILIDSGVTAYGRHCTGPSRLNADGTLDTTFVPPPDLNWRWTMASAPDGKILVAGFDHIIQLNPNGAINTRFITSFSGGADNRILCVAVQPDGQVLIEGDFTEVNGVGMPGFARLNGDMAPLILSQPTNQVCLIGDTALFQVRAVGSPELRYQWRKNSADIPGETNAQLNLRAVRLADAGVYRVVVSNGSGNTSSADASLTVLPASGQAGSTDLTFDPTQAGGLVGLEGDEGCVYRLAVQPDGKVIATGNFVGANGVPRRDLVRLNPDGSTDPSFNATITPGRIVDAIALQANGQILIAGNFDQVNHRPRRNLARLNPDGTLDASFAPTLEGGTHDFVKAIVVQPDGKILVGGNFSSANSQPRYHVARLNPDGSVDPTFIPAFLPLGDNSLFGCLALQPDGKVLVGHESCNAAVALRRLNSDGTL
ncbi:MAG TPA: immunoglobulin domain-containing protein, partial [Verrucomicrobiae bacterium]